MRGLRLAEEHGVAPVNFAGGDQDGTGAGGDQPGAVDPDTPIGRPAKDPAPTVVPAAHKPASDRKPAGDAPLPQEQKLKEANE